MKDQRNKNRELFERNLKKLTSTAITEGFDNKYYIKTLNKLAEELEGFQFELAHELQDSSESVKYGHAQRYINDALDALEKVENIVKKIKL